MEVNNSISFLETSNLTLDVRRIPLANQRTLSLNARDPGTPETSAI